MPLGYFETKISCSPFSKKDATHVPYLSPFLSDDAIEAESFIKIVSSKLYETEIAIYDCNVETDIV